MSQVEHAEIDDPSDDDDQESNPSGGNSSNNEAKSDPSGGNSSNKEVKSDPSSGNSSNNEVKSDPSGGNSSNNELSGEESAGNDSSSEEESDGDFDIQGDKQTCPYCDKKLFPCEIPLHNCLVHSYRPLVEEHVCIHCMEAFPDYFQMNTHQNQCLGNQL